MKRYTVGDISQAVCSGCECIVPTRFGYHDVPFDKGSGSVKSILVAVCDHCSTVVAVPPQSMPAIKATRQVAIKPIELNLPAPYVEILDLAAYTIDSEATAEFRKTLLVYYLRQSSGSKDGLNKIKHALKGMNTAGELFDSVPKRRISLKVTAKLNAAVNQLARDLNVKKTALIKGLIIQIDEDIVLQRLPARIEEFRRFYQF